MRTLFIMRHAKASWQNPLLSDFERPLNKCGLQFAPLMGSVLYRTGQTPDLIISSSAKRAIQTAILVKATAEVENPIKFDEKMYEASSSTLFSLTSAFPDKFKAIMIIGHNPGIEEFIRKLTGDTCPMPSASVAKILLNIQDWKEISSGKGLLEMQIRPRDLLAQDKDFLAR